MTSGMLVVKHFVFGLHITRKKKKRLQKINMDNGFDIAKGKENGE